MNQFIDSRLRQRLHLERRQRLAKERRCARHVRRIERRKKLKRLPLSFTASSNRSGSIDTFDWRELDCIEAMFYTNGRRQEDGDGKIEGEDEKIESEEKESNEEEEEEALFDSCQFISDSQMELLLTMHG